MIRRTVTAILTVLLGIVWPIPSPVSAAPVVPGFYGTVATPAPPLATALPELKPGGAVQGLRERPYSVPGSNQMIIYQNQPRAIIDWKTFDIGKDASVYFDQKSNGVKQPDWVALNRIWDRNPSQIYGRLTADGKVYLINQNGILFGPNAKVNVASLIASTLNLRSTPNGADSSDFEKGVLKFNTRDEYIGGELFYDSSKTPGIVVNGGTIDAQSKGSVFLLGSSVENRGLISAPVGQIGLIAAYPVGDESVEMKLLAMGGLPAKYTDASGNETIEYRDAMAVLMEADTARRTANGEVPTAWNMAGGYLLADTGLVGMYGGIVNHNGVIGSVTAVQRGGHVELLAAEKITTGPGSRIELPVSDSTQTFHESQETASSTVLLSGLDPDDPQSPRIFPKKIDHEGIIDAPSGKVTMQAGERVYLGGGSVINVSGLWIDKSASSVLVESQMTTNNLRDEYGQKGGLLQGETIRISSVYGSSIGDVSGSFNAEGTTAAERHTKGGNVNIRLATKPIGGVNEATGDFIVREGAVIDFSGGGFNYAAGLMDITKLVSGNRVYAISSADSSLRYDGILNKQKVGHTRWGVEETYEGLYTGGGAGVYDYIQAHTEGSDAGSLTILARQAVLNGTIKGGVTKGLFQTGASELNVLGYQVKSGYEEPAGGTLQIGDTTSTGSERDGVNFLADSLTVTAGVTPLAADFTADTPLTSTMSVVPAKVLTDAGLGTISLAANKSVTVEQGASVSLRAGGAFTARARRIEHYGSIVTQGGAITLALEANRETSAVDGSGNKLYPPIEERIYLAPGSNLSTAGERIDNSILDLAPKGKTIASHKKGGSIVVRDSTLSGQGVVLAQGALIDVSGGYQMDSAAKISGGDAGSVTLQGYSAILDGEVRGHSLKGNEGGAITIHAGNVEVAPTSASAPQFAASAPWPDAYVGKAVVGADRFTDAGFTRITLKSVNDIDVLPGSVMAPSPAKLATPVPGQGVVVLPAAAQTWSGVANYIADASPISTEGAAAAVSVPRYDTGKATSLTLVAGKVPDGLTGGLDQWTQGFYPIKYVNNQAAVRVHPGASVSVAPQGAISMSGPVVDIGGPLTAPGGSITLSAVNQLTVRRGVEILAEGYNRPGVSSSVKGLPAEYAPLDGGTIRLLQTGTNGTLVLEEGSRVSVSGASPATKTVVKDDWTLATLEDGGAAGQIEIKGYALMMGGRLEGYAKRQGARGGALSIEQIETPEQGRAVLSFSVSDLAGFKENGFDALALSSRGVLDLAGSGDVAFGRSLTLSARTITGAGSIGLSAPWVTVTNANVTTGDTDVLRELPSSLPDPSAGNGSLRLSGEFLDVSGTMLFSGFRDVTLEAGRDMRLTDLKYTDLGTTNTIWSGLLKTSSDLTLKAGRIYPTTASAFTFDTTTAPAPFGKVTILPSGMPFDDVIYSAGGSLTVKAAGGYLNGVPYGGIEHRGVLAAPMGSITLQATGQDARIYLANDSITTTKGTTAVKYGEIRSELGEDIWGVLDKTTAGTYAATEGPPEKSIALNGDEIIVMPGAKVDLSGGGTVFTYEFWPWSTGTANPLKDRTVQSSDGTTQTQKRYVIMPDNRIVLPGKAVYLSGGDGLKAGVYSLLPEEYAFLPGAMIVTDLNAKLLTGDAPVTKEGYTIMGGYDTVLGTSIKAGQLKAYEVRTAFDVLKEGNFPMQSYTAGDAGRLTAVGKTTILAGTVAATPLEGYRGSTIILSGTNINVRNRTGSASGSSLDGFAYSTPFSGAYAGLKNRLSIDMSSVSGKGFETIALGISDLDNPAGSITASTVVLEPEVTLQAENVILAALGGIDPDSGKNVGIWLKGDLAMGTGAQILAQGAGGRRGDAALLTDDDSGPVVLEGSSFVRASDAVRIGKVDLHLLGQVAANELILESTRIVYGDRAAGEKGIFLTETEWNSLLATGGFRNIGLKADSLVLRDDLSDRLTGVADTLTIDSGLIQGPGSATFKAGRLLRLLNSGSATTTAGAAGGGLVGFQAPDIEVGGGSIVFDKFQSVNMNAANDLSFKGVGTLSTGNADLNISTARLTTSYYTDPKTSAYVPVNYRVDAGTGKVTIARGTGTAGGTTTPGGILDIAGGSIDVSTKVEMPSGRLTFMAPGVIALRNGADILLQGTKNAPGGVFVAKSTGGSISIESGSTIDVSAGDQGDAGAIELSAPTGGVLLRGGTLKGTRGWNAAEQRYGVGGSLTIDTKQVSDFNSFEYLNSLLSTGGFNEEVSLRVRAGDLVIPQESAGSPFKMGTVNKFKLVADGGSLAVNGEIDAAGDDALIELYALNNLTLGSTGKLTARRTDRDGGSVYLDAGHVGSWDASTPKKGAGVGTLTLNNGAIIDVSGAPADPANGLAAGAGGTLYLRAYRNGAATNMSLGQGRVIGAANVLAETVQAYQATSATMSGYSTYSFTPSAVASALQDASGAAVAVKTLAGIEVQREGDLTLGTDWTLTSQRPGGQPGVLSVRATGNLTLNANIIDAPTSGILLSNNVPSWGLRFVAGADTTSADTMAAKAYSGSGTTGMLKTGSGKVIYTQNGPISFASQGDTIIKVGPSAGSAYMFGDAMKYSLATFGGAIRGNVGGDLNVGVDLTVPSADDRGAAIQSAVGDIDLRVGRDLVLQKSTAPGAGMGSIRTTGEGSDKTKHQLWGNGGNITLNVGRDVKGVVRTDGLLPTAWLAVQKKDRFTTTEGWVTADYNLNATQGIVAMAGGHVYARSGGSFSSPVGAFSGYVWDAAGETPTFSAQGDVHVYSGGDLKGRFLVANGVGVLSAMGSFGTPAETQLIEMYNGRMTVSAQGNIEIGAVVDPGLTRKDQGAPVWDNGYGPQASLTLDAATGDVRLYGKIDTSRYGNASGLTTYWKSFSYTDDLKQQQMLPSTVAISAGRDIVLGRDPANSTSQPATFEMLPSSTGNLTMTAGRDIVFKPGASMEMSDADPADVYIYLNSGSVPVLTGSHAPAVLHRSDTTASMIRAARDMKEASLTIPKFASVSAGRDIVDLDYRGQNIASADPAKPTDTTRIAAGRDIVYGYSEDVHDRMIELGGPGFLIVQAAGAIDLGNTKGIQAAANANNPYLGTEGSSVLVAAGVKGELAWDRASTLIADLVEKGEAYTPLLKTDLEKARKIIEEARTDVIAPFMSAVDGQAGKDITMTASQISTRGGGRIIVLTTGALNVGKSSLGAATKTTGIFTVEGGAIGMFTVHDINVNQSRIMTFRGDNIEGWSDRGNAEAGTGSLDAITSAATVSSVETDKDTGAKRVVTRVVPPAVGSGIRTMSYDPAIRRGDIKLFTPEGYVDAGEAGISGENVVIGTLDVRNSGNISFSGVGVGVPVASQSVNLGALSGSSTQTKETSVSSAAVTTTMTRDEAVKPLQEIVMKYLDMKVVGFDQGQGVGGPAGAGEKAQ